MSPSIPLMEVDEHFVASVVVSNEDETLYVDNVDASIAHAIEDYYASRGYYVAIELV